MPLTMSLACEAMAGMRYSCRRRSISNPVEAWRLNSERIFDTLQPLAVAGVGLFFVCIVGPL